MSLHCLCHKLPLVCTKTTAQIEYINNVELWLRQLWKLFDNSPKRNAIYPKVQMSLKSLVLSEKNKKVVAKKTKKIKKACQTRWLSFDAATRSIHDDFMAVLQTLRQLQTMMQQRLACSARSHLPSSLEPFTFAGKSSLSFLL